LDTEFSKISGSELKNAGSAARMAKSGKLSCKASFGDILLHQITNDNIQIQRKTKQHPNPKKFSVTQPLENKVTTQSKKIKVP
jgi:hypothetical protein